ncbi:M23 family metallopeptidase [Pseudoalteromonas ulvae]|uniref:M23 family metallopeptidase n=1 Tax=Pseudoalteromonas ulvae TaxID=107327 RepID=UPI00186B6F9E|nr:M23 family metallopeptidase [Pseudoalteromonas ulvae]
MKYFLYLLCLYVLSCSNNSENSQHVLNHTPFTHHSDPTQNESQSVHKPTHDVRQQIKTLAVGQTLDSLLLPYNLSIKQLWSIAQQLNPIFPAEKLKAGQRFTFYVDDTQLSRIEFSPMFAKEIHIVLNGENWQVSAHDTEINSEYVFASGRIQGSFFQSARAANVPVSVINQFLLLYSHQIDFQRDLRFGDEFSLIYHQQSLQSAPQQVNVGQLEFASLSANGREHKLYAYSNQQGVRNFYTHEGFQVGSFLLKTPLDGARLSSGFGLRKHPVLGYTRLHKGLDFGAPIGTPILATGKGVIEKIGREGGFGLVVKIKHANGYQTLYAHLNGFASGIKKGSRVKQGQVIGYLGNTGLSQAKHLHYEIHKNGRAIDPLTFKGNSHSRLTANELKKFTIKKQNVEQLAATGEKQKRMPYQSDLHQESLIAE